MKITKVLIAADFRNPWNPGFYMMKGFELNGIQTEILDTMTADNPYEALMTMVEKFQPDVLLYIKDYGLRPEWLQEVKARGVHPVQWYIDPVIPEWLPPFVEVADVFFTMSEGLVDEFKKFNPRVFFLSQGFEPSFFKLESITPEDIRLYSSEVTFVGNLGSKPQYLTRRRYLNRVLKEGFQLKWWGPRIPRKLSTIGLILGRLGRAYGGRFVWGQEYAKVARLSKIFLAFDSMPHIRKSMSARMYTAVGCGAFYMCQYVEGIEEFLEPGKEIVTFRDEDEMVDMIRYYLRNDSLRERIAASGRQRVLKEHTYEARIKRMLEILKDVL